MGALDVQNITCAYNGRPVLSDLSLTVNPGEVLAVIGPNGAGKTTLLRAMARLLRPRAGTLLLSGQEIWKLPPRAAARRLALAPQKGDLWPLTVEQFVGLGRTPHRGWFLPFSAADRETVRSALQRTGMEPLRGRLVTELSGGEQRRAILARALAQEPRVLLLDEPTAQLDLRYQTEILELLRHLAHHDGLAVVVTLHDLNQAALCADRLALLVAGRMLVVGEVEDVLVSAYLEEAYGVRVVVTPHPLYGTPLVTPLVDR